MPRSRPFPSRGMGGRTLFDSSMVAEDEDWESNDALKDVSSSHLAGITSCISLSNVVVLGSS